MGKHDAGNSDRPPQDPGSTGDQIDEAVMDHRMKREILSQDPTLSGNPDPIAAGGGGGGGSYRLDPDEVHADMKTFHGLIQEMKELRGQFARAQDAVHPPAEDGPSNRQASDFYDSIGEADKHAWGCMKYGDSFHDRLAKSVGDYEAAERYSYDNMHNVDPDSGRGM